MKTARKLKRGFTLVELIVVISIISILSVVGLTIYSQVQQRARNIHRKEELLEMATALETHYLNNGGTCLDGFIVVGPGYCPLSGSWFRDGEIPTDPIGPKHPVEKDPAYCFKTVNTEMHGEDDGHCDEEPLVPDNGGWCTISSDSTQAPWSGTKTWTLCANLEPFTEEDGSVLDSQNTFCVHSKQLGDPTVTLSCTKTQRPPP